MPKSTNPADYSTMFYTIIDFLRVHMPAKHEIPLPSAKAANAIRREFYSYKKALRTHSEVMRKKGQLGDVEAGQLLRYQELLMAFQKYQMEISLAPPIGLSPHAPDRTLRFVSRDESSLMRYLAEGHANATTTGGIETEEDLMEENRRILESLGIPADTDPAKRPLTDTAQAAINTEHEPTPTPEPSPSPTPSHEHELENHADEFINRMKQVLTPSRHMEASSPHMEASSEDLEQIERAKAQAHALAQGRKLPPG